MKKILFFVFALILTAYGISSALEPAEALAREQAAVQTQQKQEEAAPPAEEKPKTITGFEVLSGYGISKIHDYGNYDLAPLIFDLDFNLKPAVKKIGINYPNLLQFQLEGFINTVVAPKANAEPGCAFMLKLGFLPEDFKFQPYAKGGVGMVYMSQATREQSTRFNFIEQVGLGGHYYFTKKLGFTFECRYRHLSNAGIGHPNKGINTLFYLAGVSYQF